MGKKKFLSFLFTSILISFVFINGINLNNAYNEPRKEIHFAKDYEKFIEDEVRNNIRNDRDYNQKFKKSCIRNIRYYNRRGA